MAVLKSPDKGYGVTYNEDKPCLLYTSDDMDFYEEYTIHLTDEEQEKFFAENPEFMSEYPISRDMIYLLRDPMYRGLMRKIKKYETGVE